MPAAAVIPALIAYIKVVAVKKLVVGFWACICCWQFVNARVLAFLLGVPIVGNTIVAGHGPFTLKKLECSKQAIA